MAFKPITDEQITDEFIAVRENIRISTVPRLPGEAPEIRKRDIDWRLP